MRKTKRVQQRKKRKTRRQKGGSEANANRLRELQKLIKELRVAGASDKEIATQISSENKKLISAARAAKAAAGAVKASADAVKASADAVADVAVAALPEMPQLCFGTVQVNLAVTLPTALRVGYRHIDGADVYGGDDYLRTIKIVLAESGIPRNQLWITWKTDNITMGNIRRVIDKLACGYIDLFLVHHGCGSYEDMRVFQEAQRAGLIRFFGVSNCENIATLTQLRGSYGIYANQIQARPPGGDIKDRDRMAPDFIEQCNGLGIRIMLFATMSGVTNLENELIEGGDFAGFERLVEKTDLIKALLNKYYIQRYLTPENHNVLMVGSVTGSPRNLQQNLADVSTALSPDPAARRLLTEEQMAQTEAILKSLTLSLQ